MQVQEYDVKNVNSRLMKLSSKLSRDYGEFLAIKATINLPFFRYPNPSLKVIVPLAVFYGFFLQLIVSWGHAGFYCLP